MSLSKLFKESKSFQVIRLLNIFFNDEPYPRAKKYKDEVWDLLIKRIENSPELNSFIDLFLYVERAWNLNEISYQRKIRRPSRRKRQIEISFKQKAISHPLYIIFSSAFNDSMDQSFRDAVQIDTTHSFLLEPLSYYVYGLIGYHSKNELYSSDVSNKRYALLFFQIKAPRLSQFLTNRDLLFNDRIFSDHVSDPDGIFKILSFGILRGNIEGFIFFEIIHNDRKLEKFRNFINNARTGFFSEIIPLTLFSCKWQKGYNYVNNIAYLKAIEEK